jgi:riboflavin kinase / FMN adenylyltransferase
MLKVIKSSASLPAPLPPCAVAVGIFDGVHVGHRALLNKARALANREQLLAAVYTFDPHPATVLRPDLAPLLLEPLEVRLQRFDELRLDVCVVEQFDRQFASLVAAEFVRDVLAKRLNPRHVVVGENFNFGADQRGTALLLQELAAQWHFSAHVEPLARVDGMLASSTKVREFVRTGNVRGASLLLGRPFAVFGKVIPGDGRGHALGFATANVSVQNEVQLASGVYAVHAEGSFGVRAGVTSIGYNPTFGAAERRTEVHLLDYGGADLYGERLVVHFHERLRDERKFSSPAELQEQIARDITAARVLFAEAVR